MKKKKSKQHVKVYMIIVLAFSCAVIPVTVLTYCTMKNMKGTYVYHDDFRIAANEDYLGIIDEENEQVKVITHSGKEQLHIDISDIEEGRPDQIALGDTSCFLLYQAPLGERNSKIVQYDYNSKTMKECAVTDIAVITFRNGYLFLGEWEYDEDIENRYFYSEPYFNNFYAHSYIKETDFGGQTRLLKPDHNGECQVGMTKMYIHNKGYFFSEPEVKDYSGTSEGFFRADDKEFHYYANTKQEEKNREMLLNSIGVESDDNVLFYEIHEYQEKNLIYGICNAYKRWIPHHPTEQDNVTKSYAYRIDPARGKITVLGQVENSIGIAMSGDVFVYQKNKEIIQENIKTEQKKVIYNIKNTREPKIYVNGDYLLVVEWDKKLFTQKQSCNPVKWENV